MAFMRRRRKTFSARQTPKNTWGELLERRLALSASSGIDLDGDGDPHVLHISEDCFTDGIATAEELSTQPEDPPPVALFDLSDTFKLHSRPTATKVIYLDVDGHFTTGTAWGQDIDTPAYDTDGDPLNFSDSELIDIQDIWARVTDAFSPFDVDVTTEEPAIEDLRKRGTGDQRWGIRVVIGENTGGLGGGGIAFLGSFSWNSDTPCFVFPELVGNTPKNIAMAANHEVGHTVGLSHDGTSSQGYYPGHGFGPTAWAPIMGAGYGKNLFQWSKGEYADANNQEDDLAIIVGDATTPYTPNGNGFGYRVDDYGDSLDSATLLDGSDVLGVVETTTDLDVFEFYTTGIVDVEVQPAASGATLDILAVLTDADGNVVASSNPTNALDASIQQTVTAGWYYINVSGTAKGDPLGTGYTEYGSLGQYTLSAVVSPPPPDVAFSSVVPNPRYAGEGIASLDVIFQEAVSGFDVSDLSLTRDGVVVDVSNAILASDDATLWTLSNVFDVTAGVGDYSLKLTAAGSGIVGVDSGIALVEDAVVTWRVVNAPPYEMNDSLATAPVVLLTDGYATLAAAIGDNRYLRADVDLFAVDLSGAGVFTVDVDAQSLQSRSRLDSYIRVFDANGREVAHNDDHGASRDSFLSFLVEGGRYYVGVSAYGNSGYNPAFGASGAAAHSAGSYELHVSWLEVSDPGDPPDPPENPGDGVVGGVEPNDHIASASVLTFSDSVAVVEGEVGDGDYLMADVDLYSFEVGAGSVVTVDVVADRLATPSGLDSYLRVFDANGVQLSVNDDFGGSLDSRVAFAVPRDGVYYVGVSAFGNGRYDPRVLGSAKPARSTGSYVLSVSTDTPPLPPVAPPPPPPPPSDVGEPSDAVATAIPLVFDDDVASTQGFVGNGRFGLADVDVFVIELVAGTDLVADINARTLATPSGLDSYLQLFDRSGRLLAVNDDAEGSRDSLLQFSIEESGIYYLGVSAYGNYFYDVTRAGSGRTAETSGAYDLTVSQVARGAAFSSLFGPSGGGSGAGTIMTLTR